MKMLILHNSAAAHSASRAITDAFTAEVATRDPSVRSVARDLVADPIPHISPALVPAQLGMDADMDAPDVLLADTLITELEDADVLVIGAAFYNFTIPSTLKAWIDHVIRVGRTFGYVEGRPTGLLPAGKRAVIVVASGGKYSEGPAAPLDFFVPYLTMILGMIGIQDVTVIRAEQQSNPAAAEGERAYAIEQAQTLAQALVAA